MNVTTPRSYLLHCNEYDCTLQPIFLKHITEMRLKLAEILCNDPETGKFYCLDNKPLKKQLEDLYNAFPFFEKEKDAPENTIYIKEKFTDENWKCLIGFNFTFTKDYYISFGRIVDEPVNYPMSIELKIYRPQWFRGETTLALSDFATLNFNDGEEIIKIDSNEVILFYKGNAAKLQIDRIKLPDHVKTFVHAGFEKFYTIESEEDNKARVEGGHYINDEQGEYPISMLQFMYDNSFELAFLSSADLTKRYVEQYRDCPIFTYY